MACQAPESHSNAILNETMLQARVTTSTTILIYLVSCLGCWSGFQSSHPGFQAHQSKTNSNYGAGLASSPAPSIHWQQQSQSRGVQVRSAGLASSPALYLIISNCLGIGRCSSPTPQSVNLKLNINLKLKQRTTLQQPAAQRTPRV